MSSEEALHFLGHCSAHGWAFQCMEAFEIGEEEDVMRLEFSLLGLTKAERMASSPADLTEVALSKLRDALIEGRRIEVKIWIDKTHRVLAGLANGSQ